jgi:hypothetical protein
VQKLLEDTTSERRQDRADPAAELTVDEASARQ